MIQFNLLPDVKIEFVKAQRTKRLVIGSSLIATASAFAIFLLLLLAVEGVQRQSMKNYDADIKKYSSELKNTPDLNKILTIQNQLSALNGLHDDKVVATRMFTFMQQVTPADVTISSHTVDFTANTMSVTGAAPTLDRINTFIDTLKFSKYTTDGQNQTKAFSDIVLAQFGRNEQGSTYTLNLKYDTTLFDNKFDNNTKVELIVPKTVTTRSVVEQPTDIFKKSTTESTSR